jgi:glycosyltransferase involved in cell wall biosynthesis
MLNYGVKNMLFAVVPAKNEQGRIGRVLTMLKKTSIQKIIVVVNGSKDNTFKEIKALKMPNVEIMYFKPELGIDIPRAIGAYSAYNQGAQALLFLDGDLTGKILQHINDLILAVTDREVDLALTNCYPEKAYAGDLAKQILFFRKMLNQTLGVYEKLGVATPSHGPHAVSRRLLENMDFRYLAVPPVMLAYAVKKGFSVEVATTLKQADLGSTIRGYHHAKKVADTIIGDSLEALFFYLGKMRSRSFLNRDYQGYNPYRRFDILEKHLAAPGR